MSDRSSDFSVLVLASDHGNDGRSLLSAEAGADVFHDCTSDDFSDLDALQFLQLHGTDRSGLPILRIVGKYFPALVVTGDRLRRYLVWKLRMEVQDREFCVVYMHAEVQSEDNSPGVRVMRWVYEDMPEEFKERLRVVYFLHPGLWSRLGIATLGRLLLSGGLYWKIKYVSRLQYLWGDIKKGQVEIPEFVQEHDAVLECRPLTDDCIEPDPLHPTRSMEYSSGWYDERWTSWAHM